MRVRVYDDPATRELRPFTWIRPAARLLFGTERTQDRWTRLLAREGGTCELVTRDLLESIGYGRIGWGRAEASLDDLWVSDCVLPSESLLVTLRELKADHCARRAEHLLAFRVGPKLLRVLDGRATDERAVGARLAEVARTAELATELSDERTVVGLGDLLRHHEPLLEQDLERLLKDREAPSSVGDGEAYRRDRIRLGAGCRVDHGAVLDAREGPIVLDDGCEVHPHTWLRGPFFAGPGTRLMGGKIGSGSSFGLNCRIRGEVESTVVLGLANKAHDGFLGHSYVGEWVNLGALTTTSDLKNNYGEVRLEVQNRTIRTGLKKVGSFLGDHVKTRIGCMLTTGTVVGLGANLFGDPAVCDRWVPDFAWGYGPGSTEYSLDKFLETAEIVMGRREQRLGPADRAILSAAFRESAPARRLRGL